MKPYKITCERLRAKGGITLVTVVERETSNFKDAIRLASDYRQRQDMRNVVILTLNTATNEYEKR